MRILNLIYKPDQLETQLKQLMHTRHMEASYEGEEANYRVFL